ncbi:endonuclease YncB(thermonuclease family) [Pseudorhizobium tarimense]|uniref:Endonuclease YncB(Thermonuclease family) n=1 Tax=Pseudorhizobium tarimense TaxID=1079109 RepID=A0ABV2H6P0_9HYPH|nr:hypothetical protein [Pseudorhizobium tarimense]MCJ8519484.1 hypothetical protein [Pseudorhizobium tarimense]
MAGPKRKTARKGGGSRKRSASHGGSSTWMWGVALVAVVGGIAAYDNSIALRRFAASVMDGKQALTASREAAKTPAERTAHRPQSAARHVPVPQRPVGQGERESKRIAVHQRHDGMQTAAISPPAPIGKPEASRASAVRSAAIKPHAPEASGGRHQTKFFLCGTAKQDDCVIAADRFMLKGETIRIAGIEVPDIKKPRCEAERIKASDAKLRIRAFLDSGPFDIIAASAGDEDSGGHKIRAIMRNGVSLSDVLVREGLAKRPGSIGGWC